MTKIDIAKKEPLRIELDAFIQCITNKSDSPVSGEDGMENLNIALKFLESAKSNEVIDL